jgi:hypothetical protein
VSLKAQDWNVGAAEVPHAHRKVVHEGGADRVGYVRWS